MKIDFSDKSYVEIKKSDNPGKLLIIVQAKDYLNPLKKITNTVELTAEEFKSLISDL
jgi:nitrate reductase NapAB chaperone NapD